jgi:hypothetical protein
MGPNNIKNIDFFDCNSWIGQNYLDLRYSVDEKKVKGIIEDKLKKYNIKGNIISHHASLFYWPREGNNILSNILKSMDNQNTYGAMLMEHEYISNPEEFETGLKKRFHEGFRVLKLFPKSNKYPFEVRLFSKFYEILNYYRFPVMIGLEEIDITGNKNIEWEKIADISINYKQLPILIDGQNSKSLLYNSYFLLLLKSFENIYVTSHNLFAINQIENLIENTSPGKIIFDTYFPYFEIDLSVKRITLSYLEIEDKKRIAYKNIKKIIEEIEL